MNPDYFIIPRIVADHISGGISEKDLERLTRWRAESAENERLFAELVDARQQKLARAKFDSCDKEQAWTAFFAKKIKAERNRLRIHAARYAAAILLPACAVALLLTVGDQEHVAEGRGAVVLRLADREIDLSAVSGEIAASTEQALITIGENGVSYLDAAVDDADAIFNEIIVPKGMSYGIKLADGTDIYINADSRLRFPSRFTSDMRVVYLEGEAYFDVARDDEKLFVVKTNRYDVRVLGTRFNVSAYPEANYTRTALAGGSVVICGGAVGEAIPLSPDQLFSFDHENNFWSIENVDANYYTAWKEGKFRFIDERLEDMMQQISRWYDIEVVFADAEVKDYRFGFFANRCETIDPVLRMFDRNGRITIERKGNVIEIGKGR